MALEEVAAAGIRAGAPALVRTFRWQPSTLSMGYGQPSTTVDWDHCSSAEVAVTRRQTGGGGIYHDHVADISYSIVIPAAAIAGDLLDAYHTLCEPVLSFFQELGIDAEYADDTYDAIYEPACFLRDIHPAHDILVDGKKISGNAQYRQRDVVIQHGSILFDTVTDEHLAVFDDPGVGRDRFEARTTTISDHTDVSRREAVSTLEAALVEWSDATTESWSTDELSTAESLATEKYDADSWIHRIEPSAESSRSG